MSKDHAQERYNRPEDCPEADGLELTPEVHLAEDLDDMDAIVAPKARRRPATELPQPRPLPTEEADTEDQDHSFILLDEQGLPVPGVSATPPLDLDRNSRPTDGEEALRAWRLKQPARKAEVTQHQRTESVRRTLRGVTLAMAVLLVGGVLLGRSLRATNHDTSPQDLVSPVPSAPPAVADPGSPSGPSMDPGLREALPPSEVTSAPEEVVDDPSTLAQLPDSASLGLVDGSLRHWTGKDGYLYWQWDYLGTEPLDLQWRDAAGTLRMQDRVCDGRIDATTGRCYVGRSPARFAAELGRGATPGVWTLEACLNGSCEAVSRFEIQ
ncbi:MAG: hypothetical protein VX899_23780 [Myxococcota bacterium]|nr:hypothetical protein [Myxococcota bacterium]